MSRQVRQLLHLAEVSEAQNFAFAEVNPADLAHDVVEYLTRRADAKQVRLSIEDSGAPSAIRADKGALFILLKNLAENAINVSPVDGIVCTHFERRPSRQPGETPPRRETGAEDKDRCVRQVED